MELVPAQVCLTVFAVTQSGVNVSVMLHFGVILVVVVRKSSLALLTQPAWCLSPGECSGCGIKCLHGVPTKAVRPGSELAVSHYSLMRVCAEASHQGFLTENHMANGKGKM